jgi:hypothetical protein
MAVGCVIGIVLPAGIGWDFANFYDAGQKAAGGHMARLYDPFFTAADVTPLANLQFWSAPITAYLFAPLALLAPGTALVLFKIQNTLAYAAGLTLLFVELRRQSGGSARERAVFAAWFAVLALAFQPFWTIFRVGGQTTPTVFLLLVLALMAHTRGRPGITSGLFVTACAIKPAFAPALVVLALLSGPAMIAWTAAWCAGAAAVSVALLGWPIHAEFIAQLREGTGGPRSPWFYNSAPAVLVGNRVLLREPGPEQVYNALGWLIRLGALATIGWVLLRARAERWIPAARRHFNFMVALVACLLLATVVWEHYLTVLFLLLAFLVARWSVLGTAARGLVAAIFVSSLAQNLVLVNFVRARTTLDTHGELLAAGLVRSAPLLLCALLLVLCSRDLFRAYASAPWPDGAAPGTQEISTASAMMVTARGAT